MNQLMKCCCLLFFQGDRGQTGPPGSDGSKVMHDLKHLCINVSRFVLYPLCYLVFPSILRCDKLFKQFLPMIVQTFGLPSWITKLAQSKNVGVKWKQNRNYYVWFKTSRWSCFWPWPLFQVYYLVCKESWCYIWFRPDVWEAS